MSGHPGSRTPSPPVMRKARHRSLACAHRAAEMRAKRGNSRYTSWTHVQRLQQAPSFIGRKSGCRQSFGWPCAPARRPSAPAGALRVCLMTGPISKAKRSREVCSGDNRAHPGGGRPSDKRQGRFRSLPLTTSEVLRGLEGSLEK